VYAYWFPRDRAAAEGLGQATWLCKVGQSTKDALQRALKQCTSDAEAPVVGLLALTDRPLDLEHALHVTLRFRGQDVCAGGGREWFRTSPDDLQAIIQGVIGHPPPYPRETVLLPPFPVVGALVPPVPAVDARMPVPQQGSDAPDVPNLVAEATGDAPVAVAEGPDAPDAAVAFAAFVRDNYSSVVYGDALLVAIDIAEVARAYRRSPAGPTRFTTQDCRDALDDMGLQTTALKVALVENARYAPFTRFFSDTLQRASPLESQVRCDAVAELYKDWVQREGCVNLLTPRELEYAMAREFGAPPVVDAVRGKMQAGWALKEGCRAPNPLGAWMQERVLVTGDKKDYVLLSAFVALYRADASLRRRMDEDSFKRFAKAYLKTVALSFKDTDNIVNQQGGRTKARNVAKGVLLAVEHSS
jgi:hypothetical protein